VGVPREVCAMVCAGDDDDEHWDSKRVLRRVRGTDDGHGEGESEDGESRTRGRSSEVSPLCLPLHCQQSLAPRVVMQINLS